jgi:hypothetical protein
MALALRPVQNLSFFLSLFRGRACDAGLGLGCCVGCTCSRCCMLPGMQDTCHWILNAPLVHCRPSGSARGRGPTRAGQPARQQGAAGSSGGAAQQCPLVGACQAEPAGMPPAMDFLRTCNHCRHSQPCAALCCPMQPCAALCNPVLPTVEPGDRCSQAVRSHECFPRHRWHSGTSQQRLANMPRHP